MTSSNPDPSDLGDGQLLSEVKRLAACEREATVALIAALAEVDRRRLYLDEGYASLFTYATGVLSLSESSAYRRIEAARVVRRFPIVLARLAEGDVTLTTITLLAAHLTAENVDDLLDRTTHRKKREVELLVATLHPQPDARSTLRRLPAAHAIAHGGGRGGTILSSDACLAALIGPATDQVSERIDTMPEQTCPLPPSTGPLMPPVPPQAAAVPARAAVTSRPAVVTPLAPTRYKLQVTIGEETQHLLRRAQDLLRHAIPDGDIEIVLHRALTLLVEDAERRRFAATRRSRGAAKATSPVSTQQLARTASDVDPRVAEVDASSVLRARQLGDESGTAADPHTLAGAASSDAGHAVPATRHISAAVKREVWRRDNARCAFVGRDGHRCDETGGLEFHHLTPWAVGGEPTVEGLSLRCKAHNLREAERFFGEEHMHVALARSDNRPDANPTLAGAS